jgi:hypothetical protein
MADPPSDIDLLPPQATPWATMLSALAILFVFGGLIVLVMECSKDTGAPEAALTGEEQLRELRAAEKARLESEGYDPSTGTNHIPIERAMDILIEEGNAKGQMTSFPAAPKSKPK